MTVTVEIPMALPSAGNLHEHWRKRHQRIKAQRRATLMVLNGEKIASFFGRHGYGEWEREGARLVVTFTRVSPRKLDDDNLAFAFKGIRDEVAAYFGVNDNDPRIEWRYAQAKGKAAAVRIGFETVTAAEVAWDALMNEPRAR